MIHIGLVCRVSVSQCRAKVPVDLHLNINTCVFVLKVLNIGTPLTQQFYQTQGINGAARLEIPIFEHDVCESVFDQLL